MSHGAPGALRDGWGNAGIQVLPAGLARGRLAGHGRGLEQLHKREMCRDLGRREHAKHSLLTARGEHGPGLPGGPATPPQPPRPGCPRGVTWGQWVTHGDAQPRPPAPGWCPSPSVMSAALAAFQLIFCPVACLPSGMLRGLGWAGDSSQGHPEATQGRPEGCPPS